MSILEYVMVPPHKEGHIFIVIAAAVTLLFMFIFPPVGTVCLIITMYIFYFFRNPDRMVPQKEGLIVSPADGVVQSVGEAPYPSELGGDGEKFIRISIFLSVFNVHVNRIPVEGKITGLHYHHGKFLNASLDKSSTENERQTCEVTTSDGKKVAFVQIAGLIARRIVCYLKDDQEVRTGERFGIIRFGSRMDIYLPEGVNPMVSEGQIAIGGETILADINSEEPAAISATI